MLVRGYDGRRFSATLGNFHRIDLLIEKPAGARRFVFFLRAKGEEIGSVSPNAEIRRYVVGGLRHRVGAK